MAQSTLTEYAGFDLISTASATEIWDRDEKVTTLRGEDHLSAAQREVDSWGPLTDGWTNQGLS